MSTSTAFLAGVAVGVVGLLWLASRAERCSPVRAEDKRLLMQRRRLAAWRAAAAAVERAP